jgi:CheY-like chemotaxis protein
VVAVSANAMTKDRLRCFDVGMNDFLKKPVSLHDLKSAIDRWASDDHNNQVNSGN